MIDRSNTNEESAAARQWRMRDQLSQKNGAHSTVIQVNGDSYTGEWRNNMKEGIICDDGNGTVSTGACQLTSSLLETTHNDDDDDDDAPHLKARERTCGSVTAASMKANGEPMNVRAMERCRCV